MSPPLHGLAGSGVSPGHPELCFPVRQKPGILCSSWFNVTLFQVLGRQKMELTFLPKNLFLTPFKQGRKLNLLRYKSIANVFIEREQTHFTSHSKSEAPLIISASNLFQQRYDFDFIFLLGDYICVLACFCVLSSLCL
jgi:hypothetical protein